MLGYMIHTRNWPHQDLVTDPRSKWVFTKSSPYWLIYLHTLENSPFLPSALFCSHPLLMLLLKMNLPGTARVSALIPQQRGSSSKMPMALQTFLQKSPNYRCQTHQK
jgi:hypothetical protein